MAKQNVDNFTQDMFNSEEDLSNFLNKKINHNEVLNQTQLFQSKDEFIGNDSEESRFIIADFKDSAIYQIRTLDLDVAKSFDLKPQDIKLMFPNSRVLLQKLHKDEFYFSINDNIDILEKIEKQENKEILKESKNIDPDKLLDSISAMEGIDVDDDMEQPTKRGRKRKI